MPFLDIFDKLNELNKLCRDLSLCDDKAEQDFDLGDYLVEADDIIDEVFTEGKVHKAKKSMAMSEGYDTIKSLDRLETYTEIDRGFLYNIYAPIEYEVGRKQSDFKKGALEKMVTEDGSETV